MSRVDDLRLVVRLAALTDDRTRGEQGALERVAREVDRAVNKQTSTNRSLPMNALVRLAPDGTCTGPPCTFSEDHAKDLCPCRGSGVAAEPKDGWSRLGEEVRG